MGTQQLFIPTKIRIGFRSRDDTFTGKLAYIIYYDEKGKIRKETSWDGWRDHKIDSIEFENTPRNGYILNKGIQRDSHWGSGRSVIRVYDPRDFEFEITIDNLIGLLMHSDVSKRDILEECIFAWNGADLVLLPTNSVDYQASVEYTKKQDLKISTKELVKGRRYYKKKTNEILTYIGYLDWWKFIYESGKKYQYNKEDKQNHTNCGKKHIFYNGRGFFPFSVSGLSSVVDNDIVDNYAELVDTFYSTINSQPIVRIDIKLDDITANNDPRYGDYNWPKVFTIDDKNILSWYNIRTGYISDKIEYRFSQVMTADEYSVQWNFTDNVYNVSLPSKSLDFAYRGWGYSPTDRTLSPALETFSSMLRNIARQEGFDYDKLLPTQYLTIMNKLGYGKPVFILQNGNEAEYKTYN